MSVDFASALYLGLRHPTHSLPPWECLTTGKPASLETSPLARQVAVEAARLQGCEAGVAAASTLHLFWDVMGCLAKKPVSVLVDEGVYPIAGWGVERAMLRGARVLRFPHGNAAGLRRGLEQAGRDGLRPVVVADAVSTRSGQALPVEQYLDVVRRYGGLLVIDNTQALGLLGMLPSRGRTCGWGGGGILSYAGASGKEVIVVSSLAKAFGAPLAVLAGSREFVEEFETVSETRDHCSPPSMAALLAAQRALDCNAKMGDRLRGRLLQRIGMFRSGMENLGIQTEGGWFPVQTLPLPEGSGAIAVHARLLERGIRTVLLKPRADRPAQLAAILRADHEADDIRRFCLALGEAIAARPRARRTSRSNHQVRGIMALM